MSAIIFLNWTDMGFIIWDLFWNWEQLTYMLFLTADEPTPAELALAAGRAYVILPKKYAFTSQRQILNWKIKTFISKMKGLKV